ncbi:DUF3667 domain-containing protein [Pedobacter sp.]|uniref:DUF3667 domain-containing protein n=1 Tax=Pedobacter sp. TaxID=1411316 RepID=UPI00396C3050
MINCQNCNTAATGNFCGNCGQNLELKRIDRNYAKNEILSLLGYEKGFVFTVKELCLRPAQTISYYLYKNRVRLTKPVTFLILSSVIYTLIAHYFQVDLKVEELYKQYYGDSSIVSVFSWVQNNFGYSNLLVLVFIAFWIRIFFKKYPYNFYEIIVMLCFVIGQGMLILSIDPIISRYFNDLTISTLIYSFSFVYMSFAIGSFFERKFSNYLKAFFAYILGMVSLNVLLLIGAIVFDVITKK